jgi:phosphoribosylformylglycinamidine synthase subunit PurL
VIEDASRVQTRVFKGAGDAVIVLGDDRGELGGSEFLRTVHGKVRGDAPALDLDRERALLKVVTGAIADGLVKSAHDVSDGGIAVTLAECCFDTGGIGAMIDLEQAAELFSETASRIVISADASKEVDILHRAAAAGLPARRIGTTGGDRLRITVNGSPAIDVAVAEAEQIWSTAIETYFKRVAA